MFPSPFCIVYIFTANNFVANNNCYIILAQSAHIHTSTYTTHIHTCTWTCNLILFMRLGVGKVRVNQSSVRLLHWSCRSTSLSKIDSTSHRLCRDLTSHHFPGMVNWRWGQRTTHTALAEDKLSINSLRLYLLSIRGWSCTS